MRYKEHRNAHLNLSFVSFNKQSKLDYWNTDSTGDWTTDTITGAQRFSELQAFMADSGDILVLRKVLPAISSVKDMTGLEVGFLDAMAQHIARNPC